MKMKAACLTLVWALGNISKATEVGRDGGERVMMLVKRQSNDDGRSGDADRPTESAPELGQDGADSPRDGREGRGGSENAGNRNNDQAEGEEQVPEEEGEEEGPGERNGDDEEREEMVPEEGEDDEIVVDPAAPASLIEWLNPPRIQTAGPATAGIGLKFPISWSYNKDTLLITPRNITLQHSSSPTSGGAPPRPSDPWKTIAANLTVADTGYEWEVPLDLVAGSPYFFRIFDAAQEDEQMRSAGRLAMSVSPGFAVFVPQQGPVSPRNGAQGVRERRWDAMGVVGWTLAVAFVAWSVV